MPYVAQISRANPSAFLFLVDQSGSMADIMADSKDPKSVAVAKALNRWLQNMVMRCAKDAGVRDYFHVGVIGYGQTISPVLAGSDPAKILVPISEIANTPLRIDVMTRKVPDGAGGLVEEQFRLPVWLDPQANGSTPMCQTLDMAYGVLADWVQAHPKSYPPTVVHITDGESTDGDPTPFGQRIAQPRPTSCNGWISGRVPPACRHAEMQLFHVSHLWIQKSSESPRAYEDAVGYSLTRGRFAVSDGATSSTFAREWARLLAQHYVHYRGQDHVLLRQMLEPARRKWQARVRAILPGMPWYAQDKVRQGSHATLLGLQIKTDEHRCTAVAVGDSCLFHLRRDQLLGSFPITEPEQFNNTPSLLSTHSIDLDLACATARTYAEAWEPGDWVLLATDAIAQWLLVVLSQRPESAQRLLKSAAASPPDLNAFRTLVREERLAGRMKDDDSTLLLVRSEGIT